MPRKSRPIGPITIGPDGYPCGLHYDALSDSISRHVSHSDEFPPDMNWPDHKNSGRVERLYRDLTDQFALPPWNDTREFAVLFRRWFNDNARRKWSDHKNRSLRRYWDVANKSNVDPTSLQPAGVSEDTWKNLLATYEKNRQEDEAGMSKSQKCKDSRKENELLHRMGRSALSVWRGKYRDERGKEPNATELYKKEYLREDVLDAPEGEEPTPRSSGVAITNYAKEKLVTLQRNYDAAIADGSDESTASTRAALDTFGRVTRMGLHMDAPRGTRTATRRDAYTVQLEEQVQKISHDYEEMKQREEAARQREEAANARMATMEVTQKQLMDFMNQFKASQDSSTAPSSSRGDGSTENNDDE